MATVITCDTCGQEPAWWVVTTVETGDVAGVGEACMASWLVVNLAGQAGIDPAIFGEAVALMAADAAAGPGVEDTVPAPDDGPVEDSVTGDDTDDDQARDQALAEASAGE